MILYWIIITFHVIASLVLIFVILLQSGRGGGLSEAFGGGQTQTIFGTSAPQFLAKVTSFAAVVFLLTCLTLAIMSSKKSQSVMEKETLKSSIMEPTKVDSQKAPEKPAAPEAGKKAEDAKTNLAPPENKTNTQNSEKK